MTEPLPSSPEIEKMPAPTLGDHCRFLISSLVKSRSLLPRIGNSIRKGEKRSLGDDILELDSHYGTKIEIDGAENIPQQGGLILAISHATSTAVFPGWENKKANPVWWAAGLTKALRDRREPSANFRPLVYAPVGLWTDSIWRKALVQIYSGYPLNPEGKAPKEALRSLSQAAADASKGDAILISPEGESNTALTSAKRGVAKLAKSKRPFIPIALIEERQEDGEYIYRIKIGEPISSEASSSWASLSAPERKKQEMAFAGNIMEKIAELMPEEKQGVYA